MTTITLEVPDELAHRLTPLQAQMPMLLTRVLATMALAEPSAAARAAAAEPAWIETIDFLAASPSREAILAFRFSPAVQARAVLLVEKSINLTLEDSEPAEIDGYELLNALLIMLKARARETAQPAPPPHTH